MLFILVMEVLNYLVRFATLEQLLQPLAVPHALYRVSFYADDAVLFLGPSATDLWAIKLILDYFGHASGLHTNLTKSSASPIHCSEADLALTSDVLGCNVKEFPCTYLGLPLTLRKPTEEVFLSLIDKVADYLLGWKAPLLNKAGRLILVKVVLTATSIHHLIALHLPKWVIKAIDKKRRGFLWKGHEQANGGNCLVSWERVQRPLEYGGLGIHNLEILGWSLRIRWLWAQKTDTTRPWSRLPIQVPRSAQAMFDMAVVSIVGNGQSTLFWSDRWLDGKTVAELAPSLFKAIPKRLINAHAVHNQTWVSDIRGVLSVRVLSEYLLIWELVDNIVLQPEIPDQHKWKLSQTGSYSSRSAYAAFFEGLVKFGPWRRVWKTWALMRCKFFIWLAQHKRCWTADRLAKRSLPTRRPAPSVIRLRRQLTTSFSLVSSANKPGPSSCSR
ncbi:hypothetical protein U9M48_012327 [Paspalum notatum var. saurae]|uniref:Reverse transcriptase zinc-binding domain-containing protein n=1 Tax=Paspalum notatum var. saurae TaxID=547442 RepID=A0AAQ3WIF9_PASNO